MILTHYGGSFVKGLMQVFPDIGLQPHRFATMASMSPLSPSFSLPSLSPSLFLSLPSLCPQTRSYLQVLTVSFISISLIYPPSPVCLLPPSPSLPLPLLSPSLPLFFLTFLLENFWQSAENRREFLATTARTQFGVDPLSPEHWYHLERGQFAAVKVRGRKKEKEGEGGRRRGPRATSGM